MDIAGLVRAARAETGLSQQALARRVGICASTLSRVESGAAPPSMAMLERVLQACGRDAQWRLVHRHADLDELLDRLAADPPSERLYRVSFQCGFLVHQLAPVGVLIGGAWAAALHGLPHEHDRGRLWVSGDAETSAAMIVLLRRLMVNLLEAGHAVGASYDPTMLQRHPDSSWVARGAEFRLTVLGETQAWPTEVRMAGKDGPLRVLAPAEVGEDEGVRPEVLQRWRERRSARGEKEPRGSEQDDDAGHAAG